MNIQEIVRKINSLTAGLKSKKEYTKQDLAALYDEDKGVFNKQTVEELRLGTIFGNHEVITTSGAHSTYAGVAEHVCAAGNGGLLYNKHLPKDLKEPIEKYLKEVLRIRGIEK